MQSVEGIADLFAFKFQFDSVLQQFIACLLLHFTHTLLHLSTHFEQFHSYQVIVVVVMVDGYSCGYGCGYYGYGCGYYGCSYGYGCGCCSYGKWL